MKHIYSKINDSESTVNEILNTCYFNSTPFCSGKQGKHSRDIVGYWICPLKGITLIGRGVKNISVVDPRTGEWVNGYSVTPTFYKKMCNHYAVAENKDAHWDGMIVR